MNNRLQRILTAVVIVPLVLWILFSGQGALVVGLVTFLAVMGTWETVSMLRTAGVQVSVIPPMISAVLIPFAFYMNDYRLAVFALFASTFLAFLSKLFSRTPVTEVFSTVGGTVFSSLYAPLLLAFILGVYLIGPAWLLYLFILIWLSDSCAYFTGMAFGKRKMSPLVSPKKTWEGLAGGVAGALIGGFIFNHYVLHQGFWFVIITAVDVIVAGVVGDLFESMLKRDAGVKDSGNLFPGHGGVLDRMDSAMFGAPVLFIYLTYLLGNI